jgi:serine-type D-Ala-D-Ala carboxypeptidase/endopeptidase
MGMNWMLAPLDSHFVHTHGGGTGGFSAHAAFDLDTKRGVVILSDTALTSVGGLSSLSNHLQDSRLPLGKARTVKTPDAALLAALVGEYDVKPGMKLTISRQENNLFIQATGQAKFAMGYDSEGDFFPLEFDAVIRPKKRADGGYSLALSQGGAVIPLKKIEPKSNASATIEKLKPEQLDAYAGTYQLKPGFDLKVFVQADKLMAQATGQGEFEIEATAKDKFAADAFGIEIHFERDAQGAVKSLALLQGGQTTRGARK